MKTYLNVYFLLLTLVWSACGTSSTDTKTPDYEPQLEQNQPSQPKPSNSDTTADSDILPASDISENEPELPENIELGEFSLDAVDSIQVDFLGIANLLAVHPDRDLFLFMEGRMGEKLFLTDRKGTILRRLNKSKDDPSGYGGVCSGANFVGDTIVVMGSMGTYLFDLQFNFLKNFKKDFLGMMVAIGIDNVAGAQLGKDNGVLYFNQMAKNNFAYNSPDYYKNFNTLEFLDFETGKIKPILPLHPLSYLLKTQKAFQSHPTQFKVQNNRLSFVYHLEPAIYDVNLQDPQLKQSRTRIPISNFIADPGFPFGTVKSPNDQDDYAGSVFGLFKSGPYDLIIFQRGLEREKWPVGIYDHEEMTREMKRRNPDQWLLRVNGKEFTQPKPLSTRFKNLRSDSKGRIWAMQNVADLEEEPDAITIYQLKINPL